MKEIEQVYVLFGARVKARLRELHLKQSFLRASTGLSAASISNVCNGRQRIYVHTAVAIADALHMELAPIPERRT